MLRDGVCDETTNTELCLYDGGDCCLDREKKDTTLCQRCTCKVAFDERDLKDTLNTTDVMMFENPEDFESLILRTEKTVHDVLEIDVCSAMCLEYGDTVNGWRYNEFTGTCTCAWLKSTDCLEDLPMKEVMQFSGTNAVTSVSVTSYIQMSKTLPCCMQPNIWCVFCYFNRSFCLGFSMLRSSHEIQCQCKWGLLCSNNPWIAVGMALPQSLPR